MPAADNSHISREMESSYYAPIEQMCAQASDYITEIHQGDREQTASLYTVLCRKIIDLVREYIRIKRFVVKPLNSSDTSTVNGISPGNKRQLSRLEDIHEQIEATLFKLRSVTAPLPHEVVKPDWEKKLHIEMLRLDTHVSEMLRSETDYSSDPQQ